MVFFTDFHLGNNLWRQEFVSSFNMGNIIFVNFLSRAMSELKYIYSFIIVLFI